MTEYRNFLQNAVFPLGGGKAGNHGHTQEGGAAPQAAGRGRGRGGLVPPVLAAGPAGWPPAPPGGLVAGGVPPPGRGGFLLPRGGRGAHLGAVIRGRGGFAGLPAGGLFPHIPMGGQPIAAFDMGAPGMDDEGEEADLDDDIPANPPQNQNEGGLDFDFYQNTPIPRIRSGKQSDNVFVQQVKAVRFSKGMVLILVHQAGTVSILAISRVTPHLLSTVYLQEPSELHFTVHGLAGDLEIVRDANDPLITSPFFREVLRADSDPFFIYGSENYLTNMVLFLQD